MDEQAAPDRDAIPPQPRTVGRASVPGPSPAPADAPPQVPRAATTYTAARDVADDDVIDSAPRIPLPRASEPDADFGLPAAMRGVSEPLPRRRARSIQEFTDGPDPSSGGTPWSPFGADEKPPPPQDPNPYRVRATARVPGSLPPMDPQRADRILPDGPLIDELFFDGPPVNRLDQAQPVNRLDRAQPVNRLDQAPPAVVTPPSPPSAADYAAALMREWKSETAERDADHDVLSTGDPLPAAHDPWAESDLIGAEPLAVNSGRARNVTIRSFPEDPDADDEPQASSEIEQTEPDPSEPAVDESEAFRSEPVPGEPVFGGLGRNVPDLSEPDLSGGSDLSQPDLSGSDLSGSDLSEFDLSQPDLSESDLSGSGLGQPDLRQPDLSVPDLSVPDLSVPDLSVPDLSGSDLGEAGGQLAEPAPEDGKRLLGLFGDSFDDLSFDRTPFDYASGSEVTPEQALSKQEAPEQEVPEPAMTPDLAALYGAPTDGAEAPADAVDAYWGSPEPVAPLPRREPKPIESLPYESDSFESQPFESQPFESHAFESESFESRPYDSGRFDSGRSDSGSFEASTFESVSGESATVGPQSVEAWPDGASPYESRSGAEPVSAAGTTFGDQPGSAVAGSQADVAALEEPPVTPVIGTIRAAVRVPGLMVERPPVADDDDDRPLAVPHALAVPPVLEKAEPAPDGAIVTYGAEDWRGNVRGSAAVSSESGGTVYVSDVDDDDEDEPLSLTQKLLRSGVIVLLIVLFVAAFRYGPNIDEWLHS